MNKWISGATMWTAFVTFLKRVKGSTYGLFLGPDWRASSRKRVRLGIELSPGIYRIGRGSNTRPGEGDCKWRVQKLGSYDYILHGCVIMRLGDSLLNSLAAPWKVWNPLRDQNLVADFVKQHQQTTGKKRLVKRQISAAERVY